MDYAQDGNLSAFDSFDIAEAAGWDGDPDLFLQSLEACRVGDGHGFVDRYEDGSIYLHDWMQYGGKLFEERRKNAEKQARYRETKGTAASQNTTTESRNRNVTVTSPVTLKERRGEESIGEKNSSSFVAQCAPNSQQVSPPTGGTLSRKDSAVHRGTVLPREWIPSQELIAWAREKCPGVDVLQATDKFCDYWRAKPGAGGRKTDWEATWRNWVRSEYERVANQPQLVPTGHRPPRRQPITEEEARENVLRGLHKVATIGDGF